MDRGVLIFPDEHIERWGAMYLQLPTRVRLRVSFESFLSSGASSERLRRLAQLRVRAALDALALEGRRAYQIRRGLEAGGARCENGRLVEKLRHHSWERNSSRFFRSSHG